MAHKIPEVQGTLAAKAYLKAVRERMAPQWAQNRLDDILTAEVTGGVPLTLTQLSSIFLEQLTMSGMRHDKKLNSFAAIGQQGDAQAQAHQAAQNAKGKKKSVGKQCPCFMPTRSHV